MQTPATNYNAFVSELFHAKLIWLNNRKYFKLTRIMVASRGAFVSFLVERALINTMAKYIGKEVHFACSSRVLLII